MVYDTVPYMALQMLEIDEHKYYLSENHGDVGYEYALQDWVNSGHAKRFRETYEKHLPQIQRICEERCHGQCKGLENCGLNHKRLHELLEDDDLEGKLK